MALALSLATLSRTEELEREHVDQSGNMFDPVRFTVPTRLNAGAEAFVKSCWNVNETRNVSPASGLLSAEMILILGRRAGSTTVNVRAVTTALAEDKAADQEVERDLPTKLEPTSATIRSCSKITPWDGTEDEG